MSANRTFLFAPGNHPRKVQKVFDVGADAVVLDLEDAVANAQKAAARAAVLDAMRRPRACRGYVRVNSIDTPFCYGDVTAVVDPALDGLVLPKVESAAQLSTIDWLMCQVERERGMPEGALDLVPIIETGAGMANLDAICAATARVKRLAFGAGDYHLDMNLQWDRDEAALADARGRLVLASRNAKMEPPIDTVVIHINDAERFVESAQRGRALGFQGKLCIHPNQVAPCNEVFTPTPEAVDHARRVVSAFAEAEAAGSASIQLDGYFIDYPIVYKAQRVLALMQTIEQSGEQQ